MSAEEVEVLVIEAVAEYPGSRFAELWLRLPEQLRPAQVFEALVRLASLGVIRSSGSGSSDRPMVPCYYPAPRRVA